MSRNDNFCRSPFGDKVISFIITIILIFNTAFYWAPLEVQSPTSPNPIESKMVFTDIAFSVIPTSVSYDTTVIKYEESEKKSIDEIVKEIHLGKWGNGSDRKARLESEDYDYNLIQSKVNEYYQSITPIENNKKSTICTAKNKSIGVGLTKSGGIYYNPNTGLKETWYSQRVLPGKGLKIPGRHVNSEGFVCDQDEYICVASSTYPKGTVIETSRGMGKVYDSGCKPGILDIYVNW